MAKLEGGVSSSISDKNDGMVTHKSVWIWGESDTVLTVGIKMKIHLDSDS